MSKWIKPAAAGITVLLIAAGLAWLAGFNFDQRNGEVAYWAGVSILGAMWAAGIVGIET